MRAARTPPDLLHRIGFLTGEASTVGWRAGPAAYQRMRIEVALARIVDDAVDHAVKSIARLDRRRSHRRKLGLRDRRSDIQVHDKLGPELGRDEAVPIKRRRAREDSVVILGEPLRFHPSLSPARRTAVPISVILRLAVISLDDGFGLHRHLVLRTRCKIDDQPLIEHVVGRVERETTAGLGTVGAALAVGGAGRGMPGVGRGGGELPGHGIAGHCHRQRRIGDDPGIAATALGLKPMVPIGRRRQPDLDIDRRRDGDLDPAERQPARASSRTAAR